MFSSYSADMMTFVCSFFALLRALGLDFLVLSSFTCLHSLLLPMQPSSSLFLPGALRGINEWKSLETRLYLDLFCSITEITIPLLTSLHSCLVKLTDEKCLTSLTSSSRGRSLQVASS